MKEPVLIQHDDDVEGMYISTQIRYLYVQKIFKNKHIFKVYNRPASEEYYQTKSPPPSLDDEMWIHIGEPSMAKSI